MSILPPGAPDVQPPTPTSVYKYYDAHGVLLYVGITSRGNQRNREHNQSKEWWGFVHRQDVEHFASRPLALARETELIRQYQPPFNKQQNPSHAQGRAAYFLFASLPSAEQESLGGTPATKDARRLVTRLQHKMPLHKHSERVDVVTYVHKAAHLPLALSLNTSGDVLLENPRKIGVLTRTHREGGRVFFTFRRTTLGAKAPQAVVLRIRATQNPMTLWGYKVVPA